MASSSDEGEQQSMSSVILEISEDDDNYQPSPKRAKKSAPKKAVAGSSRQASAPSARKRNSAASNFITELRALTVNQLVDLIANVIEKHPDIKNEIVTMTPTPDLTPLKEKLEVLTKSITKAFPWSKYGSGRDAFCFRRVKEHLSAFQRELFQQSKGLVDSHQWKSSIEYIIIAWEYVRNLPNWDDPSHNKHKEQCFKKLVSHLTTVLRKGTFSKQEMQNYLQKFNKLKDSGMKSSEMQSCIELMKTLLK